MDEQEHEEHRIIDLTEAAPNSAMPHDTDRGSAWAELDEEFFGITADVFPRQLCFGMGVLLATNDEPELPRQRTAPDAEAVADRLSHQELLERINAEIDRELELRRAMRRHPSRRRF